jgi:hypothetical protein
MSDDKDHGFTDGEHNSGEEIAEADKQQPGISGWQGGVPEQADPDGEVPDDEPAVQ